MLVGFDLAWPNLATPMVGLAFGELTESRPSLASSSDQLPATSGGGRRMAIDVNGSGGKR